jgi:hypothetical protein
MSRDINFLDVSAPAKEQGLMRTWQFPADSSCSDNMRKVPEGPSGLERMLSMDTW